MKRIRFYVGTAFDADGAALSPVEWHETQTIFAAKLSKWAGGCTILTGQGIGESRKGIVSEPCTIFETLKEENLHGIEGEVVKLATLIRDLAYQHEVLYTIETVEGAFV